MSNGKSYKSRACFVPGCKTGYASDKKLRKERGENNQSLFLAPKDPIIFQQWQQAIPRTDKIFGTGDVVCALHFPAEGILNFYETKLADGTINRIKRGRPKLKNESVPNIFPNLPSYLSNPKEGRKPPCERTEMPNIKRKKYFPLPDPVRSAVTSAKVETLEHSLAKTSDKQLVDVKRDETSVLFTNLKNNLGIICTPNKQWSGTFIPGKNQVLFVEWDETYTAKKKIVICQDMSFKVLFGKTEIKLDGGDRIITSFDKLENILKLINKMEVCAGT